MKKIITYGILLFGILGATAQQIEEIDTTDIYAPVGGDFSISVLFGRGNFFDTGLMAPSSPVVNWTVEGEGPYADMIDPNENDASNMVGVEGRFFLSNRFALKLSGGAIFRNTPSRSNIESFTNFEEENNQVWIPNYASVESDKRTDLNFNLGAELHFDSRFKRVSPYVGFTFPFYYARRSAYDPAVITQANEPVIVDIGERHTEVFGVGAQIIGGVDFHLMEGLYMGAEVKPVSYLYAYSQKSPGPGLENLEANSNTFSFFGQTFLKLGFKF
ncbi:hypothetical protein GCM10023115_27010 [Pontixanthobacter gangjinensis]|uniref:Outer membrane protein beta-barrel domain-containing protein n=1 Tax=Christiangramia aestuarii TaxID=1028746 RepID=A0A7K1LMH4_9FLAO|nr:BT1926 family outer membrane beta-barrel protein [Christiangramia aestuarii]MUP41933.1 hypothetical protein [Christiangramia aestuarii]